MDLRRPTSGPRPAQAGSDQRLTCCLRCTWRVFGTRMDKQHPLTFEEVWRGRRHPLVRPQHTREGCKKNPEWPHQRHSKAVPARARTKCSGSTERSPVSPVAHRFAACQASCSTVRTWEVHVTNATHRCDEYVSGVVRAIQDVPVGTQSSSNKEGRSVDHVEGYPAGRNVIEETGSVIAAKVLRADFRASRSASRLPKSRRPSPGKPSVQSKCSSRHTNLRHKARDLRS